MKLQINKRKAEKFTKMQKLNNKFMNNQWVKEEIKKEIKKIPKTHENENTTQQKIGTLQKQFLTVVDSDKCIY